MKTFLVWVFLNSVMIGNLGPYDTFSLCMQNGRWYVQDFSADMRPTDRLRLICIPSDWPEPDHDNPPAYNGE